MKLGLIASGIVGVGLIVGAAVWTTRTARAQPTATVSGKIVATQVAGLVTIEANAAQAPLMVGAIVPPGAKIITRAASGAVLALSNGVRVRLGADTNLEIREFRQEPFDAGIEIANLSEEPSTSQTLLVLSHGEMTGVTKRLRETQGSRFTVETPALAPSARPPGAKQGQVMAVPTANAAPVPMSVATMVALSGAANSLAPGEQTAGTFRVLFRPTGSGQAVLSLAMLGSGIRFGSSGAGNTAVPISDGQELTIIAGVAAR